MTSREERERCGQTFAHQQQAAGAALLNVIVNGWNALPFLGKRFPSDLAPSPCSRCGAELP